ncbi:MAG TPA: hypothetical protein VK892_20865 [Pyrinomonadaceae bacterium]|nr:hypothetical protein [Pyrinomonadaceae bacterium]
MPILLLLLVLLIVLVFGAIIAVVVAGAIVIAAIGVTGYVGSYVGKIIWELISAYFVERRRIQNRKDADKLYKPKEKNITVLPPKSLNKIYKETDEFEE